MTHSSCECQGQAECLYSYRNVDLTLKPTLKSLPDFQSDRPGPKSLKRPSRWIPLVSLFPEIVGINLYRRTVGVLIGKSWDLGFPQKRGCHERGGRLLQLRAKVEMKSDLVAFLHDFHLRIAG